MLTIFTATVCPAQNSRYAGDPLLLGISARAQGMGNAFVAISEDATATYWNPAGLVYLPMRELQVQHAEQFGGSINHDVFLFGMPVAKGGLGFGIIRLGVDNIALTHLEDPSKPLGPENRPVVTQRVGTTDYAIQIAYAHTFHAKIQAGATLKLIRRNLNIGTGTGYGLDVGILYPISQSLRLGAVLRNATQTKIAFNTGTKDTLKPSLLMGLAYTHPMFQGKLTGSISFHLGEEKSGVEGIQGIQIGTEYLLKQTIALRMGLQDHHFTLGTGLKTRRFALDLAFLSHQYLDNTYRISASLYF
jgi:hypothetical protein